MKAKPDIHRNHIALARQMHREALNGWYLGTPETLVRYGVRRIVPGVVDKELTISMLYSRDKMHHSVGWWRNAEYEYCLHLSVTATPGDPAAPTSWQPGATVRPSDDELRYWIFAFFPRDYDKVWEEPGGTDPRLTPEEKRRHASVTHFRVFLHPEIKGVNGDPFHTFIPKGEVYDLTRWIPGLTPEKVDR